jgi:deoxyribonuclease-1-like protein
MKKQILLLLLSPLLLSAQVEFSVLSWNIRDFGKSKDDREIRQIASVVQAYDLILLQEVVAGEGGSEAVRRLAGELEKKKDEWGFFISRPTRSPVYKSERYALLWKKGKLKLIDDPELMKGFENTLTREPLLAGFEMGEASFVVMNFHACSLADRPEEEVMQLGAYLASLPESPWLIGGDFNLAATHPAFTAWTEAGLQAVLKKEKTTLKQNGAKMEEDVTHRQADNLFFQKKLFQIRKQGVINVVEIVGTLEAARRLSDHLPVYAVFIITP